MSAGGVIQRSVTVPFQAVSSDGGQAAARAIGGVGDAVQEFGEKLLDAQSQQQQVQARLDATKKLDDLQMQYRNDPDPATATQRFAADAQKIGDETANGMSIPSARQAFSGDFAQMAEARRVSVSDTSFHQQMDQFGAQLDDTIETNTRSAALASNPAERETALDNIDRALQGGVATGMIRKEAAAKQFQVAKEKLALYDGRTAALADPAALLKNLKNSDYLPDLDPLARVELQSQAEGDIRAREREARAAQSENRIYASQAIDDLRDAGASGLPVAPETLDNARHAIAAAGSDPRLVQHYKNVVAGLGVATGLRGANSQEVSATLQELAGRANTTGATPQMGEQYKAASAFATRMDAALKNDPLQWGNAQGVAQVTPLQLNGTDTPAAWSARIHAADAIAQRYNIAPRYLTAAEESTLQTQLASGTPDQKLTVVTLMGQALGSRVTSELARIAPHDPAFASAAGLALQGGAHLGIARDVLTGQQLLNEKGSELAPTPTVRGQGTKGGTTSWLGNYSGATIGAPGVRQAFSLMPDEGVRTLSAADAIYAARAARTGLVAKDDVEGANALYARAAQEAAGAHFDSSGRQFGGISTYRGRPVVVPPTVAADGFEDIAHHLTETDLAHASVTGAAPDLKGHAISDLWLVSAGNGRYAFSTTDPATGDVTPIRDKAGKPYRLDFPTAATQLRARAVQP